MSQVKNLRAMFESKGESSPPDSRGRSPTGASATSEGPRPLSKVRTSFVAVEKDGRIGLQREHSGDSSLSRPQLNNHRESNLYRSTNKMSTQDDRVATPAAESIPEMPESADDVPTGSSDNNIDSLDRSTETTSERPNAPRSTATAPKTATKLTLTKHTASKTEIVKRPATKPVATTRATGTATAVKKPAPVKVAASDAGFVKPKPRSPTKPVDLPSSLMAPTASSAHKGGASRRSISGNLSQVTSAHTAAASTASKPIKRQPSTANRKRPSLGAPPTSRPSQEPPSSTKRQSQVDDGFLARMMRPTAASSSKTADKGADKGASTTPVKRAAPRPSNVAADAAKRAAKSPVPTRTRAAKETSTADKASTKVTKAAAPVAKATVSPATAASATDAGSAAAPVASESVLSKLVEKLSFDDAKEETQKQDGKHEAEYTADVGKPEPAKNTKAEAKSEKAEAEVEKKDGKVDFAKDNATEVEEKAETSKAGGLVAELPVRTVDEPAPVETASLEEAAVEAAQVETAEEAIEIAAQVDGTDGLVDGPVSASKESSAAKSSEDKAKPTPAMDKLVEANEATAKTTEVAE